MSEEAFKTAMAWYIRAARQLSWSKPELTKKIRARAHETTALDSTVDLWYSNHSGGDEDGPIVHQ